MDKVMYFPNDVFIPFVLEELKQVPDKTAVINLRGNSMRPFLKNERDKAVLALPKGPCQKGDAVLAEVSPKHFVLHRIVNIDGDKITLRGDGNLGDEHCLASDIRAKAVGFLRKGRTTPDLTTGRKWRLYSWFWTRLYPIRRYLLFALHPHIPQALKKHLHHED